VGTWGCEPRGSAPDGRVALAQLLRLCAQLLLATGSRWPYAEELTPLYGIGKAYREAWKVVRQGLDARSPWWPFAENGWNEALGARGWPGLP